MNGESTVDSGGPGARRVLGSRAVVEERPATGPADPAGPVTAHHPTPTRALFDSLVGQWALSRTISGFGVFDGTARFRPIQADVLRYREEGELVTATGERGPAYREYFYLLRGERILVCFTDTEPGGRVLHDLLPAGSGAGPLSASAVHHCGRDVYTGHYDFRAPDRFDVRIEVRGPAKDYTIRSTYRRA
ncbi:DUF6314 family protein [Streptoalloteichus hindustanus]|uniref:DUF6314 domain-containing protein n=1 Tax=Streptoalloteichus hindustanus TaxID=2017 RepID=A0A1M5DLU1_STRHI|nr:DUF6314 family protein [Streptoalloteichus hindustanus]SHF67947.1 hypothetical protein SAMN05444320_104515 [Streptoalloteichus hindustanus]